MTDIPSDGDRPSPAASAPDPSGSAADTPERGEPAKDSHTGISSSTRSTIEWVAVIVGALVVALVVKTFLVQAFYIPSESMVPTLEIGDRVLVNKLSYEFGDIGHGDVVVFDRPGGAGTDGISELIKRVIALPGETIEGRDNQVYVDGEAVDENYLPEGTFTTDFGPEVIPDGHIWVMGDNRTRSDDSRRFKSVPIDTVVGRAFAVIWPLADFGGL